MKENSIMKSFFIFKKEFYSSKEERKLKIQKSKANTKSTEFNKKANFQICHFAQSFSVISL